jgi:hypothetical protein
MQEILGPVAERAARATGFVQRQSKMSGARFVQALVFGWLARPQASLGQLRQAAGGVAISAQGLDQRFSPAAADCLREVLDRATRAVIASTPAAVPLLQRFTAVAVQDSTVLTLPPALAAVWPGCGGSHGPTAGLKLSVRLDLGSGRLSGPHVDPGRTADLAGAQAHDPLPAGALRLADLGFFRLDELADLDAAGVFWLSRLAAGTTLQTADGRRWTLLGLLEAHGQGRLDLPIRLGVRRRLPARLLAVPVPQEVADQRRRRLRETARRKGRTVSPERLALCGWTVLATNVPADRLTLGEALVLARARWQVELLFKLWKDHNRVDEWRSAKPYRILCEVYAKLLAVTLQHWLALVGCWRYPDRSLPKAAQVIQGFALAVAGALACPELAARLLHQLVTAIATGGRIATRAAAPATFQLLLAPGEEPLA